MFAFRLRTRARDLLGLGRGNVDIDLGHPLTMLFRYQILVGVSARKSPRCMRDRRHQQIDNQQAAKILDKALSDVGSHYYGFD
jgi:hypothetical protein